MNKISQRDKDKFEAEKEKLQKQIQTQLDKLEAEKQKSDEKVQKYQEILDQKTEELAELFQDVYYQQKPSSFFRKSIWK